MSNDSDTEKFTLGELMDPQHPRRKQMFKRMDEFFTPRKEFDQALSTGISSLSGLADAILPCALKIFSETAALMKRAVEQRAIIYPDIVDKLDFLASQCWFMSMDIDLIGFEEQVLSLKTIPDYQSSHEAVNASFVKFYTEYQQYLCGVITTRFPNRAFAIQPAFDAHMRGEYALSVPVFFSQADGILFELTEKELFTSRGHISDWARNKIENSPNTHPTFNLLDSAAWTPLSQQRPFGWTQTKRQVNSYEGLNRNTTLHGLDLEYATCVNSFKAFSLLAHVASLDDVLNPDTWVTVK